MSRRFIPAALVALGFRVAYLVQTGGGAVDVWDVRFPDANGNMLPGLLYRPAGATAASPVPGMLAVRGDIDLPAFL